MLKKIQTFMVLDPEIRRLFIQAFCLLGIMRIAVLTTSFKKLVSGLSVHRAVIEQGPVDAESLAMAHRIGWAVHKAAQFTPWKSACLVQVLAAQRMLKAQGIGGAFFLGAAIDTGQQNQRYLDAHAWLTCGSEFITGQAAGHERFTVIASFTW